jgi:hypothetical protein
VRILANWLDAVIHQLFAASGVAQATINWL